MENYQILDEVEKKKSNGFLLFLRWILFIPSYLLCLTLLGYLFSWVLGWFFDSNMGFWGNLIFFIFFGIGVLQAIMFLSSMISMVVVRICPHLRTGQIIFSILTIVNFAYVIYHIWAMQTEFTGQIITMCIVFTIIVLLIIWFLVMGAFSTELD